MAASHNLNLCSQGTSLKALFSGYLIVVAVGYMMALVQIQFTHGMADGEFGLSFDDIVYSYYGKRSGSVIEAKLNGSMKVMAPDEDRAEILNWVRKGADEKAFLDTGIRQSWINAASCVIAQRQVCLFLTSQNLKISLLEQKQIPVLASHL